MTQIKASNIASLTSAQLATIVSDETGSGTLVFATNPVLVTPNLGTPSTLVGTNITGTASTLNIGGNAATATNVTGSIASAVTGTTQTPLTGGTKIATCGYADASATAAAAGVVVSGRLIAFTTITASGTFTKNAATTKIVAQIWGGGGGGVGNSSGTLSGFGGNAGSGVLTVISSPPSSISVTVGAGGSGAISFGSSGGNTSFNSVVSVGGIPGG